MYLERIPHKQGHKTYFTWLIRESYRAGGKVRHRTIANVTKLPHQLRCKIQHWLKHGGQLDPSSTKLSVRNSREYGASGAFVQLARKLGLERLIYSRAEQWRRDALALIVGRLVYQGSKLALSGLFRDSALWELCGHEPDKEPDVDRHAYRVMDRLLERQDAIQCALARRHLRRGCLVYYDLSSVYLEGLYAQSELAAYGYSRDCKTAHKQVCVGLLTDVDGCAVAIEVFNGAVADQTTVAEQIERLCGRYGVSEVVVVGDRGMLTPKRLDELAGLGCKSITALTHPQVRQLLERKLVQLELFDERTPVEVVDPDAPAVRYVLCKNAAMAARERLSRQQLIERAGAQLQKLASAKRRRCEQRLAAAVGAVLARWGVGKYFAWQIKDGRLEYQLKHELVHWAEALDGCYVIRTDVSAQQMPADVVLERYRALAHVDRAFRYLKTVALEIRPIYHQLDERIRAHAFICMLAYYLQWHALRLLAPLFEGNGTAAQRRWSWQLVLERLKSVRTVDVSVSGAVVAGLITSPDAEQQRILQLLGVKL